MSLEPPFTLTAEAAERLAGVATIPDLEPGIAREFRFEVRNKNGEATDTFDQEHYSIAYDRPEVWKSIATTVQVRFAGRDFWIPQDTLEHLRGKTLTLLRRYEGQKQPGKVQHVLIAT